MTELPALQRIRQSALCQRILGEGVRVGELREARELLMRYGTKRLGDINPSTLAALEMIEDIERLEALCNRLIEPEIRGWDDLFRGFSSQPDEPSPSSTCEAILREGREIGRFQVVRRLLRRVGAKRFGEPHFEIARRIREIQDLGRLELLAERLIDDDVKTWTDLLSEAEAGNESHRS